MSITMSSLEKVGFFNVKFKPLLSSHSCSWVKCSLHSWGSVHLPVFLLPLVFFQGRSFCWSFRKYKPFRFFIGYGALSSICELQVGEINIECVTF